MAEALVSRRSHELVESLTIEDFETASIRSAAPSYSSEAPSAHFTVPHSGGSLLPPYSAPPAGSAERAAAAAAAAASGGVGSGRHRSVPSLLAGPSNAAAVAAASRRAASASAASGSGGSSLLPPRMDGARRSAADVPNLAQFRIPSWSTISSNPNARLYHSVALRRVAAAEHASAAAEIGGLMRRLAVLERMEQEEAAASRRMAVASASRAAGSGGGGGGGGGGGNSAVNSSGASSSGRRSNAAGGDAFRPLEDPYLVGETAARRARAERVARESSAHHADDALLREDRRWDWFLGQIKNRPASGWAQGPSRLRRRIDMGMLASATRRHARTQRV